MRYIKDGKIINGLPGSYKLKDGRTVSGFKHWEQSDPEALVAEGFLPVTEINNEDYDPEIQTRTGPTITENTDHAVLDYVVTDKDLLEVKKAKKEAVKLEGRQIFKTKWDLEYKLMDMYDADELAQLEADKETLLTYYKTDIEPLIDAAGNPLAVKNITYTWPTI